MISDEVMDWITEQNPEALLADGLDGAIIGVGCQACGNPVVIYDAAECIEILAKGMTASDDPYQDALEWYEYNVFGGYVGESGPIFVNRIPEHLEGDHHKLLNYE